MGQEHHDIRIRNRVGHGVPSLETGEVMVQAIEVECSASQKPETKPPPALRGSDPHQPDDPGP